MTTSVLMKAPQAVSGIANLADGSQVVLDQNECALVTFSSVAGLLAAGWTLVPIPLSTTVPDNIYTTNTATSAATMLQASLNAKNATLNMTGTLSAGAALTLPTGAQIVAAFPEPQTGQTFRLRIINSGAGAYAWTLTTAASGTTLSGTQTIAQNTFRDYQVTFTNATVGSESVTFQSIGTGTNS